MNEILTKDEQKEVCIKLLDRFDEICKKHNIEYFLWFGSMLGAVRHKDIIPWDDDIDVLVSREDYEKLISIADEFKPLKLMSAKGNIKQRFCYKMIKLFDNETKVLDKNIYMNCENGVFIDIFPYDNRPKNIDEDAKYYTKTYLRWDKIWKARVYYFVWYKDGSFWTNIWWQIRYFPYFMFSLLFSKNKIARIITQKNAQKYPYSGVFGQNTNVDKGHFIGGRFKKSDLYPVIYQEFHGKKYPIPQNYDKILRGLYGDDYMEIPGEDSPYRKIERHPWKYIRVEE